MFFSQAMCMREVRSPNEPVVAAELLHRLFKGRHLAALHAEDAEELVIEGLLLARFVARILPFAGEFCRAGANLIGAVQESVPELCEPQKTTGDGGAQMLVAGS